MQTHVNCVQTQLLGSFQGLLFKMKAYKRLWAKAQLLGDSGGIKKEKPERMYEDR